MITLKEYLEEEPNLKEAAASKKPSKGLAATARNRVMKSFPKRRKAKVRTVTAVVGVRG